jgi:hypothetical protein
MSKIRYSSPQCPTRDYETLFNARAYISEYYVIDKNEPMDVGGSLASFFNFWFNSFNFSKYLFKMSFNIYKTACI